MCPEDVRGTKSIAENEANFYTSESQAEQNVPLHVWAWTYTPISKKGTGKMILSRIQKITKKNTKKFQSSKALNIAQRRHLFNN